MLKSGLVAAVAAAVAAALTLMVSRFRLHPAAVAWQRIQSPDSPQLRAGATSSGWAVVIPEGETTTVIASCENFPYNLTP